MSSLENHKQMVSILYYLLYNSVILVWSFSLVARIAAAVYEALHPELQDIRNELNCLKEAVSELNETVATLAEESEEHRSEMATYHTETETKLDDLQTSLQSVDTRVLLLLLPYLNDIEHDIKTELGQLVVSQSDEVKECINQTALELAVLQSSSHNALDYKLALAHNNITQEINTMIDPINATLFSVTTDLSCVKTDLSRVSDAVSDLSGDLEEHSLHASRDIQSSLQQLSVKTDTLQSTLDSVDTRMIQGFALLDYATSSELNSHDAKLDSLSTQITRDFNDVRTQLSGVSNEICDKIEDHERHMDRELDDLERTLSNQMNQGFTSLDCATSSELTLHDTLNRQINDDVNGIRSELSVMSDKIEDHENKTANKLKEIVCLHQGANDLRYTCGGTGGWRRAVYLDMTDLNTNCPPGWSETNYSKRTCGRATDGENTCDSAYFPVCGREYSQVCGKIRAYQWGWTPGFFGNYIGLSSINEAYFSGVAVMHDSPREHIWTFAAGGVENGNGDSNVNQYTLCPCDTSVNIPIPPFVGNDYFCESGYVWPGSYIPSLALLFHSDDPLWDGDGCTSNSTCCSLNNPPTFTKTLATLTTDDLELRLCFHHHSEYMDIAVELIELYVK